MAWNPTPEVQVARDAAKALTKAGRFIDRIVLLFTTEQGQIGYASYGKDSAHCGQARRLADVVYERGLEAMETRANDHSEQRCSQDPSRRSTDRREVFTQGQQPRITGV